MTLTDVKNNAVKKYQEQKVFKHNIMWYSSWFIEDYYCTAVMTSHMDVDYRG